MCLFYATDMQGQLWPQNQNVRCRISAATCVRLSLVLLCNRSFLPIADIVLDSLHDHQQVIV
ncbi:hypothetical protein VE00_10358, partial [Pseudogymnoascus sp. WSF 3629]